MAEKRKCVVEKNTVGDSNEEYCIGDSQTPGQSANRKDHRAEEHKVGAIRLVGFLYWTNIAALILLLVGFVAPGWVTFTATHRLYYQENWYKKDSGDSVYQDYALWYMTQCTEYDLYDDLDDKVCETKTYRTIHHLYKNKNFDYSRIDIGEKEITGDDRCMFHGAGLVMNNEKIIRVQALYTIGLLLSIFTLYIWHGYRAQLENGKFKVLSRVKWFLLLAVSAASAIFILAPVIMFALLRGDIYSEENAQNMETSFGSIFAGFGGGLMSLVTIVVFMQLVCSRTPGTYICSCTDEPGKNNPVVDG